MNQTDQIDEMNEMNENRRNYIIPLCLGDLVAEIIF